MCSVDFDDATDTLYSLVASEKRDKVSGYLVATGPQGSATTGARSRLSSRSPLCRSSRMFVLRVRSLTLYA